MPYANLFRDLKLSHVKGVKENMRQHGISCSTTWDILEFGELRVISGEGEPMINVFLIMLSRHVAELELWSAPVIKVSQGVLHTCEHETLTMHITMTP